MPLYLVASPIGNRSDLSARAIETLEQCEIIAAEDTRKTRRLLKPLGIRTRLVSHYDPVERQRSSRLLQALLDGSDVAVITDAGTPGVADPGFHLVRSAIDAGVDVIPIPGPSAVLAALVASGLPTDRFRFEGFLPRTDTRRRTVFEQLREERATTIYFEAPTRIVKSLHLLANMFPDRQVCVARELTKLHEEFLRGTPSEVASELASRPRVKGEITLVVARATSVRSPEAKEIKRYIDAMREAQLAPNTIRTLIAKLLGVPKKAVFEEM
jgi:16S rRNA (cytidine1402-2'-O)-methyltransferase